MTFLLIKYIRHVFWVLGFIMSGNVMSCYLVSLQPSPQNGISLICFIHKMTPPFVVFLNVILTEVGKTAFPKGNMCFSMYIFIVLD